MSLSWAWREVKVEETSGGGRGSDKIGAHRHFTGVYMRPVAKSKGVSSWLTITRWRLTNPGPVLGFVSHPLTRKARHGFPSSSEGVSARADVLHFLPRTIEDVCH